MRLRSITVRHYRVHRDVTITLDPFRTLIGGQNESGKSTLVEAVHRALFVRAKTGGEFKKGIDSRHGGGHPEVELTFEARGAHYHLAKKFSGPSGTTILTELGGRTWQGEEAEARLAEILAVDPPLAGRGGSKIALSQWSHLWVFQGTAGEDPASHANAQRDSLISRLQHLGGAAVMQSDLDARVAGEFKSLRDQWFVKQGDTARKDSDLGRAQEEEAVARAGYDAAVVTLQKLESAARDHQTACETLDREHLELAKVEAELAEVDQKTVLITRLRAEEKDQTTEAGRLTQQHEELLAVDAKIVVLREKVRGIQETLAPRQGEVGQGQQRLEHAVETARAAEAAWHATDIGLRSARLAMDLARSQAEFHDKLHRLDQCQARHDQVQEYRAKLASREQRLAKLPHVDAAVLKKLQQANVELDRAEAALQAVAATIELLAADQEVRLEGRVLGEGSSELITEDAEITWGATRLRIRPGGGAGVREARERMLKATHGLQTLLDNLGLSSLAEAAEVSAQRQHLQTEIQALQGSLKDLRAERIEEELAKLAREFSSAEAELGRRRALAPDADQAATAEEASAVVKVVGRRLQQLEGEETSARAVYEKAVSLSRAAAEALLRLREALQGEKDAHMVSKAQFDLLMQHHGDDTARAAKLEVSAAALHQASVDLQATRATIASLQPEMLEHDRERVSRTLKMRRSAIETATTMRDQSLGALRSDGTLDPREQLAVSEARLREAAAHGEIVLQRGKAISLLNRLFEDEQRALAEQFTQPLVEKIAGYLKCLFGAGARAGVVLGEGNSLGGLELVRPDSAGGAVSFEMLSGGAKEQVAAAFRLAIAEVLAAGHDHCLPVVFDDAFAYSDPERVRKLQRMLDLAAQRGLQVIVLACNPSDYAMLGAHEVRLLPPADIVQASHMTPPALLPEAMRDGEPNAED